MIILFHLLVVYPFWISEKEECMGIDDSFVLSEVYLQVRFICLVSGFQVKFGIRVQNRMIPIKFLLFIYFFQIILEYFIVISEYANKSQIFTWHSKYIA